MRNFSSVFFTNPRLEMSAPTSSATPATAPSQTPSITLPGATTLLQASKLAIQQDKPILLDYFVDSATNKAFVGEDTETKQKMLVKSAEEFTSQIQKTYKVGEDYIIMTENSIYIISGLVEKRRIQASSLRND